VLGDIFGVDGLIILVVLIFIVVGVAVPIWAVVDAASKPSAAFGAAGTSKGMWITLIAVFSVLTGIVGFILAIVYLAFVRPRVVTAVGAHSSGQYGWTDPGAAFRGVQEPPASNPPPGWYLDPTTQKSRWWDGTSWGPTAPE
jgi:hypothetical protein